MTRFELPVWPYAYGGPSGSGIIRHLPDDFQVSEQLAFEPSGAGEHVFLQVQKISENTDFIARQIARYAGVRQRDIGYAGLKDRHAIATQWFSVWLPGKETPDWSGLESENLKILDVTRHARKLKRGVLAANHFKLLVRDWQGELSQTTRQLMSIKRQGVPNYFGIQRFGHAGQNITKALSVFQGAKVKHEQRSIYLSAVRAYLFNQVLAKRVGQNNWRQGLAGDSFMFADSKAFFQGAVLDELINQRLSLGEIHPTGPLWGIGKQTADTEALALESAVLAQYPELCQGLEQEKLELARRALRVNVLDLEWQWLAADNLALSFSLPPGCFATSVLREIISGL